MNDTIKKTEEKIVNAEHRIVNAEKSIAGKLGARKKAVFERFPLVFTMLGSFGLVATFYGFERLIDRVDLFTQNPWILLGTGVSTLVFTGTLYKKLQ